MLSDPFKPMGVRQESVLKQSHNKHNNFVERYESAEPSSNTSKAEITSSSEIEPIVVLSRNINYAPKLDAWNHHSRAGVPLNIEDLRAATNINIVPE
ncbi:hypothetical protein SLA2020_450880 [Shorea laevis]